MKAPSRPSYRFCPVCGTALEQADVDGRSRLRCASDPCGWVHWDSPVPVVAAIVQHGGDVILVRSREWGDVNVHGLVTGFLERGETPDHGVLREVEEELGLQAEIVSFVGHYLFEPMNQIIAAYHVRASGEISLSDELTSFKRIRIEKLRPWPMGTGMAVSDWLASRG